MLVAYLQYIYEENRVYSHGPFTLASVQYFHPNLWGSLKSAWAAIKTWRAAEPRELRAPIAILLMWAFMSVALSQLNVPSAALLCTSYHCLLRPGEACRLRRADIMLPGDANWHVQVGMVVIRASKTARTAGRIQHVVVTDSSVC